MKVNIRHYIVGIWEKQAVWTDKLLVNGLTIFNTAVVTILSVRGLTSFFDIKSNSAWVYITLIFLGINNFHRYKFWYISSIIKDKMPESPKA